MGLSSDEKKALIRLARSALKGFAESGISAYPEIEMHHLPRSLMEKKGVFVTLYLGSEIRGCMGTLLPVLPIWEACLENSRSAIYKDPRYAPLNVPDLDSIRVEITIIDTPGPFHERSQLETGTRGLILTKGFCREVFLPGSLKDLPDDIEDIFEKLRSMAGMDDDPESPEKWEIFDAQTISERAGDGEYGQSSDCHEEAPE